MKSKNAVMANGGIKYLTFSIKTGPKIKLFSLLKFVNRTSVSSLYMRVDSARFRVKIPADDIGKGHLKLSIVLLFVDLGICRMIMVMFQPFQFYY